MYICIVHAGQGGKVQLTHEQFEGFLNENCARVNDQFAVFVIMPAPSRQTSAAILRADM